MESFSTTIAGMKGLKLSCRRTTVFKTEQEESGSGRVATSTFWTTPRYHFAFDFEFLTPTQAATLDAFFVARKGRLETFTITDPIDGSTRTVRFDTDELPLERSEFGVIQLLDLPLVEDKA